MIDSSKGIKAFFGKGAACWSLDGSPSGLIDQYGNGNHASEGVSSIKYPSIETIAGSSGYMFDGTAGKTLTVVDSPTLNPAAVTVISWIRFTPTPGTNQFYINKSRSSGTSYSFLIYCRGLDSTFTFAIFNGAGRICSTTRALRSGEVYCVIGTRVGNVLKVYINGKLEGTLSPGTAATIYDSNPLFIAGTISGTFLPTATIGETAILSYGVTAQQAADYYEYATEPIKKHFTFSGAVFSGGAQAALLRRSK